MSIIIKNETQISNVRVAGSIIKHVFAQLSDVIVAGINTLEIDKYIHQAIVKEGGKPAFLGYQGFTGVACISINEEIIHGVPSSKKNIQKGDIVSIDIGVAYQGNIADSAYTFYIGEDIPPHIKRLITTTKEALQFGIHAVKPKNRISDVSSTIYLHAQKEKLGVVREFCGHGVGVNIHEPPEIPNYCPYTGANPRMREGMIFAIEPMFTLGTDDITIDEHDDFTVKTKDNSLSAHFEHTVLVTKDGFDVLT